MYCHMARLGGNITFLSSLQTVKRTSTDLFLQSIMMSRIGTGILHDNLVTFPSLSWETVTVKQSSLDMLSTMKLTWSGSVNSPISCVPSVLKFRFGKKDLVQERQLRTPRRLAIAQHAGSPGCLLFASLMQKRHPLYWLLSPRIGIWSSSTKVR